MSDQRETLAVIGAGGFAAEVIEAAQATGWNRLAVYDDDPLKHGTEVFGIPCVGFVADIERVSGRPFVLAIGRNEVRQSIGTRLEEAGLQAVTLRHPACLVSRNARIESGAFLAPFVWIGPNVTIGRHALINVGVSVGHDAVLGDWVQLCPGVRVSGGVTIGSGSFVGSNAVVAPQVSIGDWAQIGACSFAWRAVPAGKLAVGAPAKILDRC